jgi:hypothetical protein
MKLRVLDAIAHVVTPSVDVLSWHWTISPTTSSCSVTGPEAWGPMRIGFRLAWVEMADAPA